MTTLELAYRGYFDDPYKEDTKEFNIALDYFLKGLSFQKSDEAGEVLCKAIEAETRVAFLAGVKAAVNLLTGGYDDE